MSEDKTMIINKAKMSKEDADSLVEKIQKEHFPCPKTSKQPRSVMGNRGKDVICEHCCTEQELKGAIIGLMQETDPNDIVQKLSETMTMDMDTYLGMTVPAIDELFNTIGHHVTMLHVISYMARIAKERGFIISEKQDTDDGVKLTPGAREIKV